MSLVAQHNYAPKNEFPKYIVCNAGVILCVALRAFESELFSKQKKVHVKICVTNSILGSAIGN